MKKNVKIIVPKINKLKISNLFYEMSPIHDPYIRLNLVKNIFLYNCIKKDVLQRESPISERISLPKFKNTNLKRIKFAHNNSMSQILTKFKIKNSKNMQINPNPSTNSLSSSVSREKNGINFLITSVKSSMNNKNINYNVNNRGTQLKQRFYGDINNKHNNKDNKSTIINSNMKKERNMNLLIKVNGKTYNNLRKNNSIYITKKNNNRYNNFLPKISKQSMSPSYSKETKDLFSLRQRLFEKRDNEESTKLNVLLQ